MVRGPERDSLRQTLTVAEIGTGIHFPIPIHLQPAGAALGYTEGDLPNTERIAREVLSIPMYAELTQPQLARMAEVIRGVT